MFARKHRSNEPLHYYNNNHPLHPVPHKSNSAHLASNVAERGKKSSQSDHSHQASRAKSADETRQHSRSHNHRSEQVRRSNHTEQDSKIDKKVKNKSPQLPAQPPPAKPQIGKSSGETSVSKKPAGQSHHKTVSCSPSTKNQAKNKYKKRSSTESSSVDA